MKNDVTGRVRVGEWSMSYCEQGRDVQIDRLSTQGLVMSKRLSMVRGGVLGLVVAFGLTAPARAQVARLGALGDSLTDEYAEESYAYAKNWTMQIVEFRGVNMGPTAAGAGQPGGVWGEPRRTGFENNWARYGADSATLLSDGQHTGLAAQAAGSGGGGSGGVTHAVLAIGTNDFSPGTSAYFNIYWGFWSPSQIDSYVNARVANVEAAVQTLDAAGIRLVLCNYVDFGIAPVTRQIYTNATRRERVSVVIANVNSRFGAIARQHRAVLVNLNAMGTTIFGTNAALKTFLTIGGVNIQLLNKDTPAHANPLAGFVDDGAHPHTTVQGAFANVILAALNTGWHAGYPLFTDQEIVEHAGLAYAGEDTLDAQLGGYSQFITDYICHADTDGSGVLTPQDIFSYLSGYFAGLPSADFNNDGQRTPSDIFAFLNAYFTGC